MLLSPESKQGRFWVLYFMMKELELGEVKRLACVHPSAEKKRQAGTLESPPPSLLDRAITYRTILPERTVYRLRFIYLFLLESHLKTQESNVWFSTNISLRRSALN